MRNERLSRAVLCAILCHPLAAAVAAEPAAAAAAAAVGAGSAASGAGLPAIADNLSRIENETLLLKAQERQMAVRLQLAAQRNDLAVRHAHMQSIERPARAGDPTVLAVEGIGRHPFAMLMMDNGSLMEAAIGDVLPNGMTVLSVRAGEVVVGRGRKERIRLAHAAPASPSQAANAVTNAATRAPWTLPALPALPAPPMAVMAGPGAQQ